MADGEMHGDAAAERVAENERRRDREPGDDARDVVGELTNIRVRRLQRGAEREPRQVDDVNGPAQVSEGPDLRREPSPVGGDTGQNDRVRWCAAAPGGNAE